MVPSLMASHILENSKLVIELFLASVRTRAYSPTSLLEHVDFINPFVFLDGVDVLDHAFSAIVARGHPADTLFQQHR